MSKQQAFNPYLPGYEYVPDGEPYVVDGRVYIYGSHDKFNGSDFCINNYVCWSAPVDNLSNWECEGTIYGRTQDPCLPDAASRRMFAPDMARGCDGRFYLYYAFDFSGTIAVAVCDTPGGKYEYYGRVHYADGTLLGTRPDDVFQYDPGVLADNGRIYLATGFCPMGKFRERFSHLPKSISDGGMIIELEKDMLTIKKEPAVVIPNPDFASDTSFAQHAFFEAPSLRKINNRFYYIYSSENSHELCYAISDYPDHGYVYGGVLISNGDIGYHGRTAPLNYTGTNHGSIECINDRWYVFYHRQTNGNPYSRQGCADPIEVWENGYIPQTEMTSCGLNNGPLEAKGEYNATIACALMSKNGAVPYTPKQQAAPEHPFFTQSGTDREESPDSYITNMKDGAIAGYKYFDLNGACTLTLTTRGTGTGRMLIVTDPEAEPMALVPIWPSPGWQASSVRTSLPSGVSALWFGYEGTGYIDFRCFSFS
ncbi:MAG: family 43 glycosylhydrolase [Lachnospiraceae bacterium]|nr:family 43 glycosylhydrolase [Lachnospiraceae bacterium]